MARADLTKTKVVNITRFNTAVAEPSGAEVAIDGTSGIAIDMTGVSERMLVEIIASASGTVTIKGGTDKNLGGRDFPIAVNAGSYYIVLDTLRYKVMDGTTDNGKVIMTCSGSGTYKVKVVRLP